jgi:catechol 2,3-dioxygenase-like lactoylglutathione lyase family enzyme
MERTPVFYALDHVQLAMPAGQEDAARAFYVGVLGFQEVSKPEALVTRGGAWFRNGEINVHLGVDSAFIAAKKAHPAFRCSDYEALLRRLGERGIRVTPDPLPFNNKPHCYVDDPFGNRIEFIAT